MVQAARPPRGGEEFIGTSGGVRESVARTVNLTELVESRDGSPEAKKRAELILKAMAGELTFDDVAHLIGVHVSLVYRLRDDMLKAAIGAMEPGRPGRPPKPAETTGREVELEEEIGRLKKEVDRARTAEEIAVTLPHVVKRRAEIEEKKTLERRREARRRRKGGS